jgi:hypothetical protein
VAFTVHEHVLCSRARLFKAACSLTFRHPILLLDTEPETFNAYLTLVYQNQLHFYVEETFSDSKDVRVQEGFRRMIMLWIVADELGDLQSCNSVVSALIAYGDACKKVPEGPLVLKMMDHTTVRSPLRRLFVDWFIQEVQPASYDSLDIHGDGQMLDFLLAVAKEFANKRASASPTSTVGEVFKGSVYRKPTCHYHQHDSMLPPCGNSIFNRNSVTFV